MGHKFQRIAYDGKEIAGDLFHKFVNYSIIRRQKSVLKTHSVQYLHWQLQSSNVFIVIYTFVHMMSSRIIKRNFKTLQHIINAQGINSVTKEEAYDSVTYAVRIYP